MAITPTLEIGSEVGPYRIEQLIGRGGMGVVYRATDTRLGRPVALKLLSPEYSGDRRFRARFERESRLAASIDHGGIVPIYDAGDVDGLLYIAMRFVDGSDLAQLLRREGPLEPDRALGLVGQLAEALDAAHERGLIHRDVKPSNALVAREGTREHVYLADFGLTKTSGPESVTASGQVMGTVAYMAPEVIRGEPPGPAADLYALGCVLFECLTGEVPFTGTNEAAVIYAHLESPPPRPRDRAPGLPAGLDAVLARSMAKEPDERFESGAAMVEAADVALGHATARRTRGRRRARPRRRGVVAAVGVAAVAVTVAAVWPEGDRKIAAIESDAVAVIDPGERSLRAKVELDGPPSAVAAAPNAIWVAGDRDGTVSRIDPETHTIRQTVTVGHGQSALAADRSGVWVANRQDGTIKLVSADTNAVADTFKLGSPTDACLLDGDVWVAGAGAGAVTRLDPDAHRPRDVPIDGNPLAVACGAGGVWAVSDSGRLNRIDPATNAVRSGVDVGAGASALAVGGNDVWVANSIAGTVSRVNAERAAVTAVVPLGPTDEPVAVAVGAGGVWVANRRGQTLARIDPERPAVAERFRLGNEPRALTIVKDRLWVAVAATGAGHRGGTLRVQVQGRRSEGTELDPAMSIQRLGLADAEHDERRADRLSAGRRIGWDDARARPRRACPRHPTAGARTGSPCAAASGSRTAGRCARATSSAASSDRWAPRRRPSAIWTASPRWRPTMRTARSRSVCGGRIPTSSTDWRCPTPSPCRPAPGRRRASSRRQGRTESRGGPEECKRVSNATASTGRGPPSRNRTGTRTSSTPSSASASARPSMRSAQGAQTGRGSTRRRGARRAATDRPGLVRETVPPRRSGCSSTPGFRRSTNPRPAAP